MWDHETIMMIVQGVGETLYMTVLSTVLGYLFGLPMGVLLAVSDKEGLKPNAVLYKILDCKYCEKYSIFDLTDSADSFYQSSGGKELWIYSNGSATGSGSHSFYRTNGGIVY